jgi:FkbM family methyltransferase
VKWILRILNRLGILRLLSWNQGIVRHGVKQVIPIVRGTGTEHLTHPGERWMSDVLERLVPLCVPGSCFVDVGVNLGQTLLRLRVVTSKMAWIGFEPNAACVSYVNRLIRLNAWGDTTLFDFGLGEQTGERLLQFYDGSGTDSSASLIEGFRDLNSVTGTISVSVRRWNDIPEVKARRIGMVKIDVEGAECEVLRGMEEMLATDRPYVIVEILPVYGPENTARLERQMELEQLIMQLGYSIFRILHPEGLFRGFLPVSHIGVHSDLAACDYLLVHSSCVMPKP